jgi:hypothetical protein
LCGFIRRQQTFTAGFIENTPHQIWPRSGLTNQRFLCELDQLAFRPG